MFILFVYQSLLTALNRYCVVLAEKQEFCRFPTLDGWQCTTKGIFYFFLMAGEVL